MDERLKAWHPTPEEVEQICLELRPLIRDLAARESDRMRSEERERFFRCLARVG